MVAGGGLHRLVQRAGYSLRDPQYRLHVCLVGRLAAAVACRRSPRASGGAGLDVVRYLSCCSRFWFRSDRRVFVLGRYRDTYRRPRRDRHYLRSTAPARYMHLINLRTLSVDARRTSLCSLLRRRVAANADWQRFVNSFVVTRR